MALPHRRRPTLEDFLALPEEKPALEFEEGVVTQKVSPKGPHGWLQWTLCAFVNEITGPPRLAMAFPETRVTFAGASRVPDVVVYRREHVPTTPSGEIADDFLIPPDIAIEIASPGQSLSSLVRRCSWYVANGVPLALLVLPRDRSVRVFRPNQQPLVLEGDAQIDLDDVLPGFQLAVSKLFDSLKLR
jgi:Uma2 family endonuclease